MKAIFKYIVCAGMLVAAPLTGVQAQITHQSDRSMDATATEVLKKAAERFEHNVSFSVTMSTYDSQHKLTAKQTAEVRYNKGKYRLILPDQELISDGTNVWHWNKTANEVAINKVSDDDIDLLNPGRLLANYEKSFRAKYIRTEDDGTAIIDLQPRSTRSYHKIRLFVDEGNGLLKRMEVHKYDSSREVYDVANFKKASNAASQFTFDPTKHSGVEIIDMR